MFSFARMKRSLERATPRGSINQKFAGKRTLGSVDLGKMGTKLTICFHNPFLKEVFSLWTFRPSLFLKLEAMKISNFVVLIVI